MQQVEVGCGEEVEVDFVEEVEVDCVEEMEGGVEVNIVVEL